MICHKKSLYSEEILNEILKPPPQLIFKEAKAFEPIPGLWQ
jgi:hypothetical protein